RRETRQRSQHASVSRSSLEELEVRMRPPRATHLHTIRMTVRPAGHHPSFGLLVRRSRPAATLVRAVCARYHRACSPLSSASLRKSPWTYITAALATSPYASRASTPKSP